MNLDTLIRNVLDEWSTDAVVPGGLADRALRRHHRRRVARVAVAMGCAAILTGAGVVVHGRLGPAVQPTHPVSTPTRITTLRPAPASTDTSLHTDPSNAPPRRLVAAGHTAISAYYTVRSRSGPGGQLGVVRTWHLYDPASGGYRATSWDFLDVAPGLHLAAVLDGPLPTTRIGLLDMRTQRVTRWISLGRPAGGVSWSPDGSRLLVTTYDGDPDLDVPHASTRSGFYVVDAGSGQSVFHPLAPDRNNLNGRQDLGWSRNGALIWAPTGTEPARVFYDLNGRPRQAPPHEARLLEKAGLSPDGRLLAVGGRPPGPETRVQDVRTGRIVGVQQLEQLNAWADDTHLIGLACGPDPTCAAKGEFHNRYVLVGVNGKTVTPLTGYQNSQSSGAWSPLFTRR
jgi:hypothetical protein